MVGITNKIMLAEIRRQQQLSKSIIDGQTAISTGITLNKPSDNSLAWVQAIRTSFLTNVGASKAPAMAAWCWRAVPVSKDAVNTHPAPLSTPNASGTHEEPGEATSSNLTKLEMKYGTGLILSWNPANRKHQILHRNTWL